MWSIKYTIGIHILLPDENGNKIENIVKFTLIIMYKYFKIYLSIKIPQSMLENEDKRLQILKVYVRYLSSFIFPNK